MPTPINDHIAVEMDPASRFYGWQFYRHPDGHWVTERKLLSDSEITAASILTVRVVDAEKVSQERWQAFCRVAEEAKLATRRADAAEARVRELEEALGFYADPENWKRLAEIPAKPLYGAAPSHQTWFIGPHCVDGREIAREALAPKEDEDA